MSHALQTIHRLLQSRSGNALDDLRRQVQLLQEQVERLSAERDEAVARARELEQRNDDLERADRCSCWCEVGTNYRADNHARHLPI